MAYQRGLRAGPVVGLLLIAGQGLAEPGSSRARPGAGAADRIPHHDVLELFGGQSAIGDDAGDRASPEKMREIRSSPAEAGTGLRPGDPELRSAGPADGSPGGNSSKAIRRPAPDDRPALANGGSTFGERRSESMDIRRGKEVGGRSLLWDFLPLLAVLALIVVMGLVVKRFLPSRRLLAGSGVLEIVARTPLSSRQSLVLVKMGRRLVLLGVTAGQISTLCQVDDPEQVALLVGEIVSERPGSMTQGFARAFNEETRAFSNGAVEQDPALEAGGHVRGLLEKVRRLKRKREVA